MLGWKFCRKEQARRYLDCLNTSERKTFHGLQQYCSIAFQLAQDLHVIVESRRAAGEVLADRWIRIPRMFGHPCAKLNLLNLLVFIDLPPSPA